MSESQATAIGKEAKAAFGASQLVKSSHAERVNALRAIKEALKDLKPRIQDANKRDVELAQKDAEAGRLSNSLVKRLDLFSGNKWEEMLQGLDDVAALPDPADHITYASELDDNLELYRHTCPIGVLLVIFESRPEVVVNISALAIKSGNAAILKGGKESINTTAVLSQAIRKGLMVTRLPGNYIQTVQTRQEVSALLELDKYIDLVIPRGSNALVKSIQNSTRIAVMGHADGLCSVFLDEAADMDKAVSVVLDAKTNYPSACNAAEILIVHTSILNTVWHKVATALLDANVELLCDAQSLDAIRQLFPLPSNFDTHVKPSTPEDYETEHLSLKLSVISLPSLQSAIEFINAHSSHHTDAIVTENDEAAAEFCRGVDSAGTFINASTRFADGFRYGFGTEVGISTGRIHARGPVGLEGLMTYKYMIRSKGERGHAVGDFGAGEGKKQFKHGKLSTDKLPFSE